MVILGVDPGTASTGYGVVAAEGSRLRSVAFGCVRTKAGTPLEQRLAAIARAIDALIAEHAPDAVAVEGVYVGANPRNALAIGQARGAVLAAAGVRGVPVAEYAVSEIKTAVCGYGRADKQQVQRMVGAVLGMDEAPGSEHEADALAAAVCHASQSPLAASLRRQGVRA
jgi:crossover junction endodeoxyribonuclease RuvC